MRLVAYETDGGTGVGVRHDGSILATGYTDLLSLMLDGERGLERARAAVDRGEPVAPARDLAPIARPGKILCSGVNYASHKDENPDAVFPEEPFFFSKLPSAVIGPGESIVIPRPETQADYEVELAVVIGHSAHQVAADEALGNVFGYTVLNDVSARDIQFKDNQITLGKGIDTFSPLGPEVVTADEIPDPQALHVASYLNGTQMQSSPTADMIFPVARLIEFVSAIVTLEPGDIVTTGTPAGVGAFRDPPVWLKPGDEITVEVDRIGRLTNPVVAGW
jgi:2-keto-4-pentenoate hydratase/2-oxohepta-3-ene-1,7-dioic acid hydratase in catechol pathway